MDQPQFFKDPKSGKVFELKAVEAPDREDLVDDLEDAQSDLKDATNDVNAITKRKDNLVAQLKEVDAELIPALEAQKEAQELVTFRQSGLDAYDAAPTGSENVVGTPAGTPAGAVDGAADNGGSGTTVDNGDESETATDEPAKSQDFEVPVRRRAAA